MASYKISLDSVNAINLVDTNIILLFNDGGRSPKRRLTFTIDDEFDLISEEDETVLSVLIAHRGVIL